MKVIHLQKSFDGRGQFWADTSCAVWHRRNKFRHVNPCGSLWRLHPKISPWKKKGGGGGIYFEHSFSSHSVFFNCLTEKILRMFKINAFGIFLNQDICRNSYCLSTFVYILRYKTDAALRELLTFCFPTSACCTVQDLERLAKSLFFLGGFHMLHVKPRHMFVC